jgi:hypothetical protein
VGPADAPARGRIRGGERGIVSSHPSLRPSRQSPETLLRTTGQVARLPSVEARGSERRTVNFAADLREPGSELVDVEVADLSKDGFMMRCSLELEPGAAVWLKLAGFEPMKSEIIWIQDGKAGCRFCTPLYPAILDLIIQSQPAREVRRVFAPPALLPPLPDRHAA